LNTQDSAACESPKLSLLSAEEFSGMRVFEIELFKSGSQIAPFKASRFTVEPGCSSPEDRHEVREIWMVAEGEGELIYDDQTVRISAADVLYFESHKSHLVNNDGDMPLVIYSVWWKG
jgi:mannose-6-phosphate isomerase-like protein (cupin superfamily)